MVGATTFNQLIAKNTSYANQAINASLKSIYGWRTVRGAPVVGRPRRLALSAGSAYSQRARAQQTATPLANCTQLPQYLASNSAIPYVEAYTEAEVSSFFARAVTGSPPSGMSTCARVAWGSPGGLGEGNIPITVSGCDWMHATGGTIGGGGGSYYPGPVYGTAGGTVYGYGDPGQPPWPAAAATPPAQNAGGEVIMLVQNPPAGATQPTACPTWQGHALPGGFGILETTSDPCVARAVPVRLVAHVDGKQCRVQPRQRWSARSYTSRCSTAPPRICLPALRRCRVRTARWATATTPTTTEPVTRRSTSVATASTSPVGCRTSTRAWLATTSRATAVTAASPVGSSRDSFRPRIFRVRRRGRLLRHLHHPACGLRSQHFREELIDGSSHYRHCCCSTARHRRRRRRDPLRQRCGPAGRRVRAAANRVRLRSGGAGRNDPQ